MSMSENTSKINKNEIYDVLIVGGGMVGASLAVALMPLKLKVGLIDAFEFGVSEQPSYDDRAIALSYGSSRIFSGMGLWDKLSVKTSSIKKIHVSDRGHFGAARLSAKQENVPALGYLVESRVLGEQLYDVLQDSDVDIIAPATLKAIGHENNNSLVRLEVALTNKGSSSDSSPNNGDIIESSISENEMASSLKKGGGVLLTRLLVGADGTQSKVRELSNIEVKREDYQQSAVVANVTTEKPHNNEAFERFTDTGPIALLPLSGNRSSLVWTHDTKVNTDSLDETMALDDTAFLKKLDKEFGYRLGRFIKVGKRTSFSLSLVTSKKNTAPRTVIVGNASHTLHPVAGQGLNLALRDIAVLADLIANSNDLGGSELLQAYETQRAGDLKTTVNYTDSLVRLFSNDNFLLGHARAGGLLGVDRIGPLRKIFTRRSMGFDYRQSRLARGMGLRQSGERAV